MRGEKKSSSSFYKVNRSARPTLTMGIPDESANTVTINGTTFEIIEDSKELREEIKIAQKLAK